MITLEAVSTFDQLPTGQSWESVPMWNLRYDHFLGDIVFKIDDCDFSTRWGWVPVLDFALGFNRLLTSLTSDGSATFEFTESEATLTLRRSLDVVALTSSYSSGVARVDVKVLRVVVYDFVSRIRDRLLVEHPSLARNEDLNEAFRTA